MDNPIFKETLAEICLSLACVSSIDEYIDRKLWLKPQLAFSYQLSVISPFVKWSLQKIRLSTKRCRWCFHPMQTLVSQLTSATRDLVHDRVSCDRDLDRDCIIVECELQDPCYQQYLLFHSLSSSCFANNCIKDQTTNCNVLIISLPVPLL